MDCKPATKIKSFPFIDNSDVLLSSADTLHNSLDSNEAQPYLDS